MHDHLQQKLVDPGGTLLLLCTLCGRPLLPRLRPGRFLSAGELLEWVAPATSPQPAAWLHALLLPRGPPSPLLLHDRCLPTLDPPSDRLAAIAEKALLKQD